VRALYGVHLICITHPHRRPPRSQPRPPYTCTLCSARTPSSWPSYSFNSYFACTLVRYRTPSPIRVLPGNRPLMLRAERMWKKRSTGTGRGARKARGRRGPVQPAARLGGCSGLIRIVISRRLMSYRNQLSRNSQSVGSFRGLIKIYYLPIKDLDDTRLKAHCAFARSPSPFLQHLVCRKSGR